MAYATRVMLPAGRPATAKLFEATASRTSAPASDAVVSGSGVSPTAVSTTGDDPSVRHSAASTNGRPGPIWVAMNVVNACSSPPVAFAICRAVVSGLVMLTTSAEINAAA